MVEEDIVFVFIRFCGLNCLFDNIFKIWYILMIFLYNCFCEKCIVLSKVSLVNISINDD